MVHSHFMKESRQNTVPLLARIGRTMRHASEDIAHEEFPPEIRRVLEKFRVQDSARRCKQGTEA